jgi:hypothetical protein
MRFAYADPPYIGMAKRYYKDQASYGGEVDHKALLERLYEEFPDGWALSSSMKGLWTIIPLIPMSWKCRIACWAKPYVGSPIYIKQKRPIYSWEPVVFRGGRPLRATQVVRDYLVCNNLSAQPGRRSGNGKADGGGLAGAKPDEFCYWLFELLNMQTGDEFVDLFPGTGRVTRAWQTYCDAGVTLFCTEEK